jgi:hypothetical protein
MGVNRLNLMHWSLASQIEERKAKRNWGSYWGAAKLGGGEVDLGGDVEENLLRCISGAQIPSSHRKKEGR